MGRQLQHLPASFDTLRRRIERKIANRDHGILFSVGTSTECFDPGEEFFQVEDLTR